MKIKPFTEAPQDVAAYGPVADEAGKRWFELDLREVRGGLVVAVLDGVADRNAAEALKGLRLYVSRDALPPADDDEFYHADLLGLEAVMTDGVGPESGKTIGTVRAIIPAGMTEVLEIDRGPGTDTLLVPFTRAAVPEIDIKAGRLVIDPPGETEDEPGQDGDNQDGQDNATNDEINENGKTEE